MAEHNEIVSAVVRELSSIRGLKPSIEKVTESARLLFDADQAGITLIRARGELETVGPTHEIVTEVDSLQYELGQGPCVDAVTEQHVVTAHDLDSDPRWPEWGPRACGLGIQSILAADLQADGRRIGALNLYGSRVNQFKDTDAGLVLSFSAHASAALAAARTHADPFGLLQPLGRHDLDRNARRLGRAFLFVADRAHARTLSSLNASFSATLSIESLTPRSRNCVTARPGYPQGSMARKGERSISTLKARP